MRFRAQIFGAIALLAQMLTISAAQAAWEFSSHQAENGTTVLYATQKSGNAFQTYTEKVKIGANAGNLTLFCSSEGTGFIYEIDDYVFPAGLIPMELLTVKNGVEGMPTLNAFFVPVTPNPLGRPGNRLGSSDAGLAAQILDGIRENDYLGVRTYDVLAGPIDTGFEPAGLSGDDFDLFKTCMDEHGKAE
jgi:hypothetical protein